MRTVFSLPQPVERSIIATLDRRVRYVEAYRSRSGRYRSSAAVAGCGAEGRVKECAYVRQLAIVCSVVRRASMVSDHGFSSW
jgi:hypothetical protein